MIDAAPPAYLTCTIGKQVVEITADEASQTVTVYHPKWRISAPAAAVYSPERVIVV